MKKSILAVFFSFLCVSSANAGVGSALSYVAKHPLKVGGYVAGAYGALLAVTYPVMKKEICIHFCEPAVSGSLVYIDRYNKIICYGFDDTGMIFSNSDNRENYLFLVSRRKENRVVQLIRFDSAGRISSLESTRMLLSKIQGFFKDKSLVCKNYVTFKTHFPFGYLKITSADLKGFIS